MSAELKTPDTQDLSAHLERWIGNPQVGALTLAVVCRLADLRFCQLVAEEWFTLMAGLLGSNRRGELIAQHEPLRNWAHRICRRRPWNDLAHSADGLCLAIGLRVNEHLYSLARTGGSGCRVPGRFSAHFVRFYLRRRVPKAAFKALKQIAAKAPRAGMLSYVDPYRSKELVRVGVSTEGEIRSRVEAMRVRPHSFRAEALDNTELTLSGFQVAQIAEESEPDRVVGHASCDTITDANPNVPSWPHAATETSAGSSHRCAVHTCRGGLEWSDWPQICAVDASGIPPIWKFTTGVFARKLQGGCTHYQLVGRTTWEIHWRAK